MRVVRTLTIAYDRHRIYDPDRCRRHRSDHDGHRDLDGLAPTPLIYPQGYEVWGDLMSPIAARCMELVAKGDTDQQIAITLDRKRATVLWHLRNVRDALDIQGRVGLARWWIINVELRTCYKCDDETQTHHSRTCIDSFLPPVPTVVIWS